MGKAAADGRFGPDEAFASTVITHGGKVVAKIPGGFNSWDVLDRKAKEHHRGTREWVFIEVRRFCEMKDEDVIAKGGEEKAKTLFWLMGGGGTGKSVTIAVVCKRLYNKERLAAFHFCRHDNEANGEPIVIVRLICRMLCDTIDGFREELGAVDAAARAAAARAAAAAATATAAKATAPETAAAAKVKAAEGRQDEGGGLNVAEAMTTDKLGEAFETLVAKPLAKVKPPADGESKAIVIDALDEIKKEWVPDALRLITQHLAKLPPWIRIIITSRDEDGIKNVLSKTFDATELRCDEERNRGDVKGYLRHVATVNVASDVTPRDLERAVLREFKWVVLSACISSCLVSS